jgi:acyl-CoA reductase-like NAD-dependent aldehyde dehydrogenase
VLVPLIASISGGNVSLIKASELSPYSALALTTVIEKYLSGDAVQCVNGGVEVSKAVLEYRYDFICFTGSPNVGKIVHQVAARNFV